MSDTSNTSEILTKITNHRANRRRFLAQSGMAAGMVGLGVLGADSIAALGRGLSSALPQAPTEIDIALLNFALNLEYLEAEYYLRGVFGRGLSDADITGQETLGPVIGGRPVPFATDFLRQNFEEIAHDEETHVRFLRAVLAERRIARPTIDLANSFTAAARAAGLIGPTDTADAFANEDNFLLGAFIFEDVGVTAYKGAARFIEDKDVLEAAAGILAVEAYHAGEIRTECLIKGLVEQTQRLSDLRDSVDGPDDRDQGIVLNGRNNIVPSDENAIAFSRTPRQVLNIVYLQENASQGGFFPQGVNGVIR